MQRIASLTLRTRFVIAVLLGTLIPLGLVGVWLANRTARSGEALLRVRLESSLAQLVEEVGLRWVRVRSNLLDIADLPSVRDRLQGRAGAARSGPRAERASAYGALLPDVEQVIVRDAAGAPVLTVAPTEGGDVPTERVITALVPVALGIYDPATGEQLGTLHAQVRMSSLTPSGAGWVGVGGSVLGIFSTATGVPLLPLTIDQDVFRRPRFSWAEEPWISVRQLLSEPGLELVLAAPTTPFREPFARATREGTLALILVALTSFALVTVLARRLTRPLGDLAWAAEAVAAGDLEQRVDPVGPNEVTRVARAFNQMTESLRSTLAELSQRESLVAVGEFAASLAHEIRNPLSSIRLDLQRVEESTGDPKARELIARALDAVSRLERTVSGALEVARSGRITRRIVDVRQPLEAAVRSASPEFAACGATLVGPEAARPVSVRGDPDALEQLFLNLLLNAAQAAGRGGRAGVEVVARNGDVRVSFWDTGPGVSPEVRTRMFEPFFSTRSGGTGLGLAVARRVVEAHGGSLTVSDRDGGGAILTVRLPGTNRTGSL